MKMEQKAQKKIYVPLMCCARIKRDIFALTSVLMGDFVCFWSGMVLNVFKIESSKENLSDLEIGHEPSRIKGLL